MRLEVRASKLGTWGMGCAALLFGGLGFGVFATGVKDNGLSAQAAGIGLAMFALLGGLVWLVRRAHRRSVRCFTDAGLERHDGTTLPWADLTGVVYQVRIMSYRHKTKHLWRAEIHFRNGETVWLLPNYIANLDEVLAYVAKLPCEHNEVVVGAA